ncbi:MAG: hypothetical protein IJP76_05350 [Paludibacteraceae bacterium]|nr:hypothetical protein [Paludibacteraceae bacterium]MBQ6790852.1 hypothetical protein [Paludibacteraceae bacterium]
MKKFIISIAFILIGVYVVDRLGGEAMWWVNQHTHDVSGPKIKYLANDVDEDIVMMGTSRCNCHYVPSIISDTLGVSVYNGGIDASDNIYAHYIMLNHIMAHHAPKVICLEVMTSDFVKEKDPFTTVTFFAPYFGRNAQADSVFRLAGSYYQYKVSHLYRYNSKSFSNIAGLLVNRHLGGDHGYIPPTKNPHFPDTLLYRDTPHNVDNLKTEYVQKFVDLCYKNGTKVVFVVSPCYSKIDTDFYDVLKEIARKNNIPFLDYHTPGLYHDHPEYFKDPSHLRADEDARRYSSVFAHDLKQILKQESNMLE